jgi:hypothetical protein
VPLAIHVTNIFVLGVPTKKPPEFKKKSTNKKDKIIKAPENYKNSGA